MDPERRYLHGTGVDERRRLEAQADLLGGEDFLPPLARGMRVLDVGCGTGAIARRVARRVAPGEVVGVDRERDQIGAAQEIAATDGVEVTYRIGTAEDLAYPDGSFDAAYCRFLLEHVPDPGRVIAEMARVVRPGGWICTLEWEPDTLVMHPTSPSALELWQRIYLFQASTGVDPRVGRRLYQLFREAGLSDVRADAIAWSVTAGRPEDLRLYVAGAREIVRQTRDQLIGRGLADTRLIEAALSEYDAVLASPASFVAHTFCRAIGIAG